MIANEDKKMLKILKKTSEQRKARVMNELAGTDLDTLMDAIAGCNQYKKLAPPPKEKIEEMRKLALRQLIESKYNEENAESD